MNGGKPASLNLSSKKAFLSDLHLTAHDVSLQNVFIETLSELARKGYEVYCLGDLFEYWIGPSQLCHPGFLDFFRALLHLTTRQGLKFNLLKGNRDFTLDDRMARYLHSQLLGERFVLGLPPFRALLLHGDLLFNNNVWYPLYRTLTHSPLSHTAFSLLPDSVKYGVAEGLRTLSRDREKTASTGLPEEAQSTRNPLLYRDGLILIESYLQRLFLGYDLIICGHIHRKQITHYRFRKTSKYLVTLPAWDETREVLIYQNQILRFVKPEFL